jgi:hypothetical protein
MALMLASRVDFCQKSLRDFVAACLITAVTGVVVFKEIKSSKTSVVLFECDWHFSGQTGNCSF